MKWPITLNRTKEAQDSSALEKTTIIRFFDDSGQLLDERNLNNENESNYVWKLLHKSTFMGKEGNVFNYRCSDLA